MLQLLTKAALHTVLYDHNFKQCGVIAASTAVSAVSILVEDSITSNYSSAKGQFTPPSYEVHTKGYSDIPVHNNIPGSSNWPLTTQVL